MKFWDTFKLVIHEYKHGKMEWIVSVILQFLIFSCSLFLLSVVFDIDDMGSNYLDNIYREGYTFTLKGYTEENRAELEEMGFFELYPDEDGGSGTLENLDGIWRKKIRAAARGKDIWNEEIDEFLIVIGFFQATLGAVCILMVVVLLNNLTNSFAMKLSRRTNYINMLFQLGCTSRMCRKIYYEFFSIRNILALFVAALVNMGLVAGFNQHIYQIFGIDYKIKTFNCVLIVGMWIIVEVLMRISFHKIWRRLNENSGSYSNSIKQSKSR